MRSFAAAQDAGAIRPDIGPGDVAVLMAGIAHATSLTFDIDPMLRHRYLAIMLDGLRPLDPTPTPRTTARHRGRERASK